MFAPRLFFLLFAVTTQASACSAPPPPPPPLDRCAGASAVDPSAPVVRLDVRLEAGSAPLAVDEAVSLDGGVVIRPSKARLYLSEIVLLTDAGERVAVELVDAAGATLPYELALVDLDRPQAAIHLRAPEGRYRGMTVSVGVPSRCSSGEPLNHADASSMHPPLDVDSDMYWSWNAGYVFLKFEGQVNDGAGWAGFFYHVGGDDRLASLTMEAPFTVGEGEPGLEIVADFARLFVAADGGARPDLRRGTERRVHGGPLADVLAANLRGSGLLRLEPRVR